MDQPERWKNRSGKIFQGCFISTFTLVRCVNFKNVTGNVAYISPSPTSYRKNSPFMGNRFGYLNRGKNLGSIPERTRNPEFDAGGTMLEYGWSLIVTRLVMHVGNILERKRVRIEGHVRRRTKFSLRTRQHFSYQWSDFVVKSSCFFSSSSFFFFFYKNLNK